MRIKNKINSILYFGFSALQIEYKSKGIIVQSLCPGYVVTKLSGVNRNIFSPNPDEYVESALKTIGKQTVSYGYLLHVLQVNHY